MKPIKPRRVVPTMTAKGTRYEAILNGCSDTIFTWYLQISTKNDETFDYERVYHAYGNVEFTEVLLYT